jgi:asparagine synthase (glutamine-hydrolysing)
MSGLFGYFSNNLDPEKIINIVKSMEFTIKKIMTAHSCIIGSLDLKSIAGEIEQVPIEDGVGIVTSGESYNDNFSDLKKEIAHIYRTGDFDRLKNLNGSFVAAIYDNQKEKLTVVNDRYGSIKLFYHYDTNRFCFAPKIQPLLKLGAKKTIRKDAVFDFFIFRYLLEDKTFFEDILQLPPASILEVTKNGIKLTKYWTYQSYNIYDTRSKKELVEELGTLWQKAVERRLKKDGTIIIQISGGLDSRAILAAALKCTQKENILTYTFGEKESYDFKIGKNVAEKAGVSHISLTAKKADFENQYNISMNDIEGMIDATPYFSIEMDQCLAKYGNRIYSGHMGGEIMGPQIFHKIRHLKLKSKKKYKEAEKILFNHHKLNNIRDIQQLFHPTYLNNQSLIFSFEKTIEDLSKYTEEYLPNYCAAWLYTNESDKYTAFCNLRYKNLFRYSLPFLDNDLVDFMLKVPPKLRINKALYKSMLLEKYPELFYVPIRNTYGLQLNANPFFVFLKRAIFIIQKKINIFSSFLIKRNIIINKYQNFIDYDNLLRVNNEYRTYVKKMIDKVKLREYFNANYIEELWQSHIQGRRNYAMLLGLLVTFELFLERYVDS